MRPTAWATPAAAGCCGSSCHSRCPRSSPGIRLATVSTIGLVTVTFIVDQGGLGRFIQDGYQRDFHTPLVVGIVLSVALAIVADLAARPGRARS